MTKKLFLTIILAILTISIFAQDGPKWIRKKPKPKNSTYYFEVVAANGKNAREAKNEALTTLFIRTAYRLGQDLDSESLHKSLKNGESYEVLAKQFNVPIYICGEWGKPIKEGGGGYRIYILSQVAKSAERPLFDYDYNGNDPTAEYSDVAAFFKSMFVPGLGQFGKRHYGEGVFTFLTEAACLGGAYYTYTLAQNQADIMNNVNTSYNDYMTAKETYNNMRLAHMACLGVAAGVYVFNLYR